MSDVLYVYSSTFLRRLLIYFFAAILAITGLGILALVAGMVVSVADNSGQGAGGGRPFLMGFLGIGLLVFGVSLATRLHRSRGLRIVLTTSALEATSGKQVDKIAWEQVNAVYFNGGILALPRTKRPQVDPQLPLLAVQEKKGDYTIVAPQRFVCLQLNDQTVKEFPSVFPGFGLLCDLIQQQTLPPLLRNFKGLLESHDSVQIGPLTVGRDKLICGKVRLAWRDIDRVNVQKGWLEFFGRGEPLPRAVVEAETIPNLHVLLHWMAQQHRIHVGWRPPVPGAKPQQ